MSQSHDDFGIEPLDEICHVWHNDHPMTDRASEGLKLYAATPDLVKALTRLLDAPCCNEDEQEDEDCEAIQQAIETIAKATGKTV
ncbi:MAG: hypothetical protein ABSA16_18610 [Thermoguttaceae bacterium]